jgi:hypothetical protein
MIPNVFSYRAMQSLEMIKHLPGFEENDYVDNTANEERVCKDY